MPKIASICGSVAAAFFVEVDYFGMAVADHNPYERAGALLGNANNASVWITFPPASPELGAGRVADDTPETHPAGPASLLRVGRYISGGPPAD